MNSITESIQRPEMTPVPVLIVAYKNPDALYRCWRSIRAQSIDCWTEIHPNSSDAFCAIPGGGNYYSTPIENIGYTRGMNSQLQHIHAAVADHPYRVLLNQDIVLKPDAIENAVRFMDEHPRCAIAGFKQLDASDPDLITHGGTGAPYPAGVHLTGRVSSGDCNVSRKFLWVNGAAMIVRLEALKDIGLMDERFFNIGSDSDWCLTAWMKNHEVWYCAEAVCLHETHGCSREPNQEQVNTAQDDMRKWGEKWSGILRTDNFADLDLVAHAPPMLHSAAD